MYTNPEIKEYRGKIELVSRSVVKAHPPPVVLLYQCLFNDEKPDASNCGKIIADAMYGTYGDRLVLPWPLLPLVYPRDPCVLVWLVKL